MPSSGYITNLDLAAGASSYGVDGASIRLESATEYADGYILFSTNLGGSGALERMRITNNGNVGIGTTSPSYMLHVNGSVAGVGAYNALSDIRYKKDVQSLAHSLAKILAIRGVTYKWIDEDKYGSQTQIGVIAQEIEKIVPEVVTTGSDGVKRVKYTDLIPLVIEAMQELNVDLGVLKAENERLKADSAILKAKSDKADARADKAETETATLKARADKADTEIRAKDAAVAQLKAESANLKAALCAKFSDLPICASNLAE